MVIADKKNEVALIGSIMFGDRADLLDLLEEKDFHYPETALLFGELSFMRDEGLPIGDAPTMARWLTTPAAKNRANKLNVDGFAEICLGIFQQQFTAVHADYYFRAVRLDRCRRSLALLAKVIAEKNEEHAFDVEKTIGVARAGVDQIWQRWQETKPEES